MLTTTGFSFVHFTDTHVMAGGTYGDFRLDTAETLRKVIAAINALEPRPGFAVVGGDLVSPDLLDRSRTLTVDEYVPSYELLWELLGELACPTHLLLGNHDHRAAFYRVMAPGARHDTPHCWAVDHLGYHFVGLDSHVPGRAWGELGSSQLEWLRDDLITHRGHPTLIFVHHHLWPIGIAWLDMMLLRDGEDLTGMLRDFRDVRWIICGHVHQDQMVQRGGLTMWTTPSTCYQISKLAQSKNALPGPPAFRLVNLATDSVHTRIVNVPEDPR